MVKQWWVGSKADLGGGIIFCQDSYGYSDGDVNTQILCSLVSCYINPALYPNQKNTRKSNRVFNQNNFHPTVTVDLVLVDNQMSLGQNYCKSNLDGVGCLDTNPYTSTVVFKCIWQLKVLGVSKNSYRKQKEQNSISTVEGEPCAMVCKDDNFLVSVCIFSEH